MSNLPIELVREVVELTALMSPADAISALKATAATARALRDVAQTVMLQHVAVFQPEHGLPSATDALCAMSWGHFRSFCVEGSGEARRSVNVLVMCGLCVSIGDFKICLAGLPSLTRAALATCMCGIVADLMVQSPWPQSQRLQPQFTNVCTFEVNSSMLPLLPWLCRNRPPPRLEVDLGDRSPTCLSPEIAPSVMECMMTVRPTSLECGLDFEPFCSLTTMTINIDYCCASCPVDLACIVELMGRSSLLRTLQVLRFRTNFFADPDSHYYYHVDWDAVLTVFCSRPWTRLQAFEIRVWFAATMIPAWLGLECTSAVSRFASWLSSETFHSSAHCKLDWRGTMESRGATFWLTGASEGTCSRN